MEGRLKLGGRFWVECWGLAGDKKWEAEINPNTIVDQALSYALSCALAGGTPSSNWYVGVMEASPSVAAGDSMGSHAGWTEATVYTQGTRPAYTDSMGSQLISNQASKAVFTINGADTLGGAFLVNGNTIAGAQGILFAGGAFNGGDQVVASLDTINVRYDVSAASV